MRKTTLVLLGILTFLLGFFVCRSLNYYGEYQNLRKKPEAPNPIEKKLEPKLKPEFFFQSLSVENLLQFDKLYEQRQNDLRDIIASGSQADNPAIPNGVFAQIELIQHGIKSLAILTTASEGQAFVKQALLTAYQFLEEAYHQEIEFLKKYPAESGNISFITENIFALSSKDQRSGYQFLDCLINYRKLLAEAIREDQSLEKNQSRVKDLVTLNTLIAKYKTRLNVPKETF